MLTSHEVITIVTDLMSKCHAGEPDDLGQAIWAALTDNESQARDLTLIAVTAVSFATVLLDRSGLGVEPSLDALRFETTWRDLTERLSAQLGDSDG